MYEQTFSASEAAEITGVSTDLQRKWRQIGILGPRQGKGWTRWGPQELAGLMTLGKLAAVVGPTAAVQAMTESSAIKLGMLVYFQAMAASAGGHQSGEDLGQIRYVALHPERGPRLFSEPREAVEGATEPVVILDTQALGAELAERAGVLAFVSDAGPPPGNWRPAASSGSKAAGVS